MKKTVALMVLVVGGVWADSGQDLCAPAKVLFEDQKGEEAKVLWEQAAKAGSAEAHFQLAYCFSIPRDEYREHMVYAARRGHAEALDHALDDLLFRADSLRRAKPKEALTLYRAAKAVNPALELYHECNTVAVLEMCAELPPFDVDDFLQKYGVKEEEGQWDYGVWKLAEEASCGGRFGKPDPELVFQLVARGGGVPAELEYAVLDFHAAWKAGTNRVFTIDEYITSGAGAGFCANRERRRVEKELCERLEKLKKRLDGVADELLVTAQCAAFNHIEFNVFNIEVHEGSWSGAEMINSLVRQKTAYVELLEKAEAGWIPESMSDPVAVADELSGLYFKVLEALRDHKRVFTSVPIPETAQVEEGRREWISHAEASPPLLHALNPMLKASEWRVYLDELRIAQLKVLLEAIQNSR